MLYTNSSVTCLKFAPKWSFSYFQPILAVIFVTIVKLETIPDLYTLAILVLINQLDEIGEKQLLVFGSRGGQNSPLMHVPICLIAGTFTLTWHVKI